MIEKRRLIDVPQGDGSTLHRIILESPECEKGSPEYTYIQSQIIKMISETLDLVSHNGVRFDTLLIKYSGSRWVAEGQIITK